MMYSPIRPIVTDTGIVVIGVSDSSPSTKTGLSSFISHFGILDVSTAAVEAYEHASNRLPSWSVTTLSANNPMTDLSFSKTIWDKSIIPLSRIPLSTTLAISITYG